MRLAILVMALVLLLTGCQKPAEPVSYTAEMELSRLNTELVHMDADTLDLQRNLALWYNVNLQVTHDQEFRNAYDEILFYTDGAMGSLEIPSKQVHLPIYHGTDRGMGVGHAQDTAFPIGGVGNHPVLMLEEDIGQLDEGEKFVIHILGETLTYRVVAVREEWDTTVVQNMDYCSLILGEEYQILGVRAE